MQLPVIINNEQEIKNCLNHGTTPKQLAMVTTNCVQLFSIDEIAFTVLNSAFK